MLQGDSFSQNQETSCAVDEVIMDEVTVKREFQTEAGISCVFTELHLIAFECYNSR